MSDLEAHIGPLLGRAGDQLKAGDLDGAASTLTDTLRIAPNDPRALNLQALTLFRSQKLDEAREIYLRLVERIPDDIALRLNLGLVELKLEKFTEAAGNLEIVVANDPDDQRAQGYLGLALLRSGEVASASVAFAKAGRGELAQKLASRAQRADATDARNNLRRAARDGDSKLDGDQPFLSIDSEGIQSGVDLGSWQLRVPGQGAPLPGPEGVPAPEPQVSKLEGAMPVAAFATNRLLRVPIAEPFAIGEGGFLLVRVDGQQATRTANAVVSTGTLAFTPLQRRVRGVRSDELFSDGDSSAPMMQVDGKGIVVFAPAEGEFAVLDLAEDIVYVRENELFAFDLGLHWESGRIPGRAADPVRVVQLRGTGRLVMRTTQRVYTLKTEPESSLFVDARALVGWIGRVVPRFVSANGESTNFIDCSGEGVLLLEEPLND